MTNWRHYLRLSEVWKRTEEGTATFRDVARVIAIQLQGIKVPSVEREEFSEEFFALADDNDAGVDDFDSLMDRLYDWADEHLVWVETF